MTMRHALILPLLALAACATAPAPSVGAGPVVALPVVAEPAAAEPAATCRNDALRGFVGQPASQALGTQLLKASGARALRWVAKGMMVTMDYRDDRLTVRLDAANRIERASCG
jgi:hypothetical protein